MEDYSVMNNYGGLAFTGATGAAGAAWLGGSLLAVGVAIVFGLMIAVRFGFRRNRAPSDV